jgi:hypothetical protein
MQQLNRFNLPVADQGAFLISSSGQMSDALTAGIIIAVRAISWHSLIVDGRIERSESATYFFR